MCVRVSAPRAWDKVDVVPVEEIVPPRPREKSDACVAVENIHGPNDDAALSAGCSHKP